MNNPTPKKTKTKVDTFEDTLFLMDLYKHKMQLAKYEKKVLLIILEINNLTVNYIRYQYFSF